jgi:multiple sugar transport system substrate-binding protein
MQSQSILWEGETKMSTELPSYHHPKPALSRRQFLRVSALSAGALALAACAVPAAAPAATAEAEEGATAAGAPAVLQGATINFLSGGWFVPELVDAFQAFATEWATQNNVTFAIDVDSQNSRAKLATAIETGQGANLAQIDFAPISIREALVDVTDIAEQLQAQQGEFSPASRYTCTFDGQWLSIPYGEHPRMINYREDWFREVGFDTFPATWEEALEAGRLLKEAGHPYGWTLSDQSPADGVAACLVLLWAFGGKEFNADGSVALDSQETIDALNFAIQLYNDACDPASTSYQEATNNQAFLAGQISMTYNVNTIYLPAIDSNPELAEVMNHALPPAGPGGAHNYTGVASMVMLDHTEGIDRDAAHQFMLDFFTAENYANFIKEGQGYLIPSQPVYDDMDVWPTDPKLQATREAGKIGRVSGFELTSPNEMASLMQTQLIIPKMFSTACSTGDARAALDAAMAQVQEIQGQIG